MTTSTYSVIRIRSDRWFWATWDRDIKTALQEADGSILRVTTAYGSLEMPSSQPYSPNLVPSSFLMDMQLGLVRHCRVVRSRASPRSALKL
jgi:hypothetical protein